MISGDELWRLVLHFSFSIYNTVLRKHWAGTCLLDQLFTLQNVTKGSTIELVPSFCQSALMTRHLAWSTLKIREWSMSHITRSILSSKVDRYRRTGRPKKIWVACKRTDMCVKGVNTVIRFERGQWNMRTFFTGTP